MHAAMLYMQYFPHPKLGVCLIDTGGCGQWERKTGSKEWVWLAEKVTI